MNKHQLQTKRIELRIKGRAEAREVLALLEDMHEIQRQACVEFLMVELGLRPKEVAKEIEPVGRLGAHFIEYGEFRGEKLEDVPKDRLDWYLARAEENVKTLTSYLNHPQFRQHHKNNDS